MCAVPVHIAIPVVHVFFFFSQRASAWLGDIADWRRWQIHPGAGSRGDMMGGAGGGSGVASTPAAASDGCDHHSSGAAATAVNMAAGSGAAATAVNMAAGSVGQHLAAAEAMEVRVDQLMHRLSGVVMETLGVSLVTGTAKEGAMGTAPARAVAVFMAMSAARKACIEQFEACGRDELDAVIRATAAAMQVAMAALPRTPAARAQPLPATPPQGWVSTKATGTAVGGQPSVGSGPARGARAQPGGAGDHGSSAGKWATGGEVSPRLGQYNVKLDGVPTDWQYRGIKTRIRLALRDSSLLLFAVRDRTSGRVEVRTTSREVMMKMRETLHGLKCGSGSWTVVGRTAGKQGAAAGPPKAVAGKPNAAAQPHLSAGDDGDSSEEEQQQQQQLQQQQQQQPPQPQQQQPPPPPPPPQQQQQQQQQQQRQPAGRGRGRGGAGARGGSGGSANAAARAPSAGAASAATAAAMDDGDEDDDDDDNGVATAAAGASTGARRRAGARGGGGSGAAAAHSQPSSAEYGLRSKSKPKQITTGGNTNANDEL